MSVGENKASLDPRSRNKTFTSHGISGYLIEYADTLANCLKAVDPRMLEKCVDTLKRAMTRNQRVYVAGNGGSAAIADHLCCDFTKGTWSPSHKHDGAAPAGVLKTHSLNSNTALFSALANDFGYEEAFAAQIAMYGEPGDVLLVISSSGNSENILKAVEAARKKSMEVIGLCGFEGGKLKSSVDVCLHVPFPNYGIVEDAHQALMHSLAQFLLVSLQR